MSLDDAGSAGLAAAADLGGARHEDLLALDEALDAFAEASPRAAELVKLRYFVGMNIDEAAEVLGISEATAKRWWAYARAWLFNEISPPKG